MNDQDTFALVIVKKATEHIASCFQNISNGDQEKARESSLQAKVLLNLIDPIENHAILQLCKRNLGDVVGSVTGAGIDHRERSESSDNNPNDENVVNHISGAANTDICFADIVGHSAAKDALYENIVLPMLMPEELKSKVYCGIRANPGNVLLFGIPGTGKTILALCDVEATAVEAGALFLAVRPSDLLSKYQGESEKYLRGIFDTAKKSPKCIIFFDEFDSIAISRGGASSSSRDGGAEDNGADGGGGNSGLCRKLLAELLLQLTECKQLAILPTKQQPLNPRLRPATASLHEERAETSKRFRHCGSTGIAAAVISPSSPMQQSLSPDAEDADRQSGLHSQQSFSDSHVRPPPPPPPRPMVVVIAATNRPTDIDPAVLRRFESKINVLPPSEQERADLFAGYLRQVDHSLSAMQLAGLAEQTDGWTGCDIENFTREAAMAPVRRAFPMTARVRGTGGDTGATQEAPYNHLAHIEPITMEDFKTAWENMILRNQY